MNTGATSYVTQTGVNTAGQPVYSVTPTYPASTTTAATTCAGTTVTNSDGTRSCVTQVGTSNTGYPINQVRNIDLINLISMVANNIFEFLPVGYQFEHRSYQLRPADWSKPHQSTDVLYSHYLPRQH